MCGATYFKPGVGMEPCVKCGSNSVADLDRKTCDCKTGYKRATKNINDYTTECFSKLFYSILYYTKPLYKEKWISSPKNKLKINWSTFTGSKYLVIFKLTSLFFDLNFEMIFANWHISGNVLKNIKDDGNSSRQNTWQNTW